jgi:hypothetical protein
MNKKEHKFQEKIECIFNLISKKDLNHFVKLFFIKDGKTSFEHRKSYIYRNWIKKKDKPIIPKKFKKEYMQYPFYELNINRKRLFDSGEEFLDMDIESFCKKIKDYIHFWIEIDLEKEIGYRYVYVFNIQNEEQRPYIDYYEINYKESISINKVAIEVKPPQNKSFGEGEYYIGELEYKRDKIILTFENSGDYISMLFNKELSQNQNEYLVGVGIGISSFNKMIPIAKKVVLSKELIDDISNLYLTLNETEILVAKENTFKLNYHHKNSFQENHLSKYINKINKINNLFKTLNKENIFNSFYQKLTFKEFSSINSLFQRFKQNRSYFITYRKRVFDTLFNSYEKERYNSIYIVMPTFTNDNIFEYLSPNALSLQNSFIELTKKVKISIVFVLKDCNEELNYEFKSFLEKIYPHTNIYISTKKRLDGVVNSIDFLYTNRENFLVSRFLRVDRPVFNIYEDKSIIAEHQAMFKKIINRSIEYSKFRDSFINLCEISHPILKTLSGVWYSYTYGSHINSNNDIKFWNDKVVIYENGKVDYYSDNIKTAEGYIIIKNYQSILILNDILTNRLITIVFDHQEYKIQKAFMIKSVTKQIEKDFDMFTIGIFSRKPIEISKAKEILGDIDNVRILESGHISNRLINYLIDEYGYNRAFDNF